MGTAVVGKSHSRNDIKGTQFGTLVGMLLLATTGCSFVNVGQLLHSERRPHFPTIVLRASLTGRNINKYGALTPAERVASGGGAERLGAFLYEVATLAPCRYIMTRLGSMETECD